MKRCYHRECDSKRNGHKGEFADYDFLVHTVQTVVDAVSEMAGAECPLSKRSDLYFVYSLQQKYRVDQKKCTTFATQNFGHFVFRNY